ncbi:hypothetical protein P4H65_17695 [Paenibacillus chitinolyticus]|uniref:hypothetical protein n=1 Tax=Paenibacillus chitinolyticus TaxID=79263 RepID=UPI002DBB499C|nr:hypothetical protein [Paenibacillus chitinolyticus]MEC0247627.1 hypothetical protein [Paenibacillus chitinolyticus]
MSGLVWGTVVAVPWLLVWLQNKVTGAKFIIDVLAYAALVLFSGIAGITVAEILVNNTVFMTSVHKVFLNPFFLASGGWLGLYALQRLIVEGIFSGRIKKRRSRS